MRGATATFDRTLALPRVAAALGAILLLAVVLPFGAVRTLHARRLSASDRTMATIAAALRAAEDRSTSPGVPPGTQILVAPGNRAQAVDDRWNTAAAFPLDRVVSRRSPEDLVDPWGNAYVATLTGFVNPRSAWILSAGPDGILQTPLDSAITAPSGDDRGVRVR
jgi:hypothetical protein